MATKRIGVLFGMVDTFPWALIDEINARSRAAGEAIAASAVKIGALRQDTPPPYDVILDRISHEIPFYRTFLKCAIAGGTQVVNNPFWFSADDKYFGTIVAQACGVGVPRGGTGMSPWRMMNEWGIPTSYLEALAHKFAEE